MILAAAIILALTTFLCGCASEKSKSSSNGNTNYSNHVTTKLTIDDIKKKYTDAKIKSIKKIGNDYILVESKRINSINMFDLYNLKSGAIDALPTMGEFVTLEKIESENYFIFLSSGKNSESAVGNFPYIIRCIRIKNDFSNNNDFIALRDDKYFGLDYSIQSGSKDEEVISELGVTFNGLEILFEPIKGEETKFYAAYTDIPCTITSYNKELNQIVFQIGAMEISSKLKNIGKVKLNNNQYMSSYEILQQNSKTYIVITVKDLVKTYTAKTKTLPNGLPYLSIMFSNEQ